nr:MAG TPA: DNA-directed RNA polymerase [Caudoviricetes sp.]
MSRQILPPLYPVRCSSTGRFLYSYWTKYKNKFSSMWIFYLLTIQHIDWHQNETSKT